mgnify:CR=1 FL=1
MRDVDKLQIYVLLGGLFLLGFGFTAGVLSIHALRPYWWIPFFIVQVLCFIGMIRMANKIGFLFEALRKKYPS